VPAMPLARLEAGAMAAFVAHNPRRPSWTLRFGALAATVIFGLGGFVVFQSWQSDQKAMQADADAFAEELLTTDLDMSL
jgi:hypothetical protein